MKKKLLFGVSVFIVLLVSLTVIKDFTVPLTGPDGGDNDFWEYMGYFIHTNISFFKPEHYFLPHIDFNSDQHLYPFGGNHALQGWGIESCLWYAICYELFGNWGNWLGYYYIFSVLITFWGSFLLLKAEIGFTKSFGVAVIVALFNFYALQRFPYHYVHAIQHWLTLSLILDFILFRRFYSQKNITLNLLLLKALILILVLGLEVGYVVGLALSSFTLTLICSLIILIYRTKGKLFAHFKTYLNQYAAAFRTNRKNVLLLILIAFFGYLYVPIVSQLFLEVKSFPEPTAHGNWWTHPLRLLLPLFFPPEPDIFHKFLKDANDVYLCGMVGWLVLSSAMIGLWKLPKKDRITYIPLLILFILCVFYHPRLFPTLKIFPWFEYARVPGRSTIIYPTILTLLAIPAFEIPAKRWMKLLYGIILLIGLAELFVNYRFQYNKETYQFADNFREYMDTVKEAPGEAIFDYPFCIVGGNGVGGKEGLASLYVTMSHVSTMQRFHNKKTIGHYYGRLNEFQISQQVALGWGTLLPTKVYDPYTRQKLSACLTTFQFEQLVRFVKYNDFAGINLYTDLLPDKACEQKFISTFGQPTVGTLAPGLGRVIFIPKKTSWFTEIDKVRGKSINFGH